MRLWPSTAPRPAVRLAVATTIGVAVGLIAIQVTDLAESVALGWCATAFAFFARTLLVIWPMKATETANHATHEEPTRTATDMIVLIAALASLAVVARVLLAPNGGREAAAALAVVSVLVSWATVHTMYILRYARLYYTKPVGGIDFHQSEPPRYSDFMYIGLTVGMSYAISDTDLASSAMRRIAIGHALLSYLFGTVILAALINLVAGL